MAGTPIPTIDATGIHAPTYADCLAYFQAAYQGIYGSDVYLGNDSQDGQLIALLALSLSDANASAIAAYNAFSPATAQGAGLSSVVKINGIARKVPSYSTVDLTIVGQVGSTILNGKAGDGASNQWLLPASVTIPGSGSIVVTATAATLGAISAAPGTVTAILTPTLGWQTVTNVNAATPGQPVESDATLRLQQSSSTALPSLTVLDGISGAVQTLAGVTRAAAYENDTDTTDANGIPSHSLAMVVEGGDAQSIANTIASKKTPGAGTYGTTSESVIDAYGVPRTIRFFRPTLVPITVAITVHNLTGYSSTVGTAIVAAVVAHINALPIGQAVLYTRLYVPANLAGPFAAPASPGDLNTFDVISVAIARSGSPSAADVSISFNEAASCATGNVTLTVS